MPIVFWVLLKVGLITSYLIVGLRHIVLKSRDVTDECDAVCLDLITTAATVPPLVISSGRCDTASWTPAHWYCRVALQLALGWTLSYKSLVALDHLTSTIEADVCGITLLTPLITAQEPEAWERLQKSNKLIEQELDDIPLAGGKYRVVADILSCGLCAISAALPFLITEGIHNDFTAPTLVWVITVLGGITNFAIYFVVLRGFFCTLLASYEVDEYPCSPLMHQTRKMRCWPNSTPTT